MEIKDVIKIMKYTDEYAMIRTTDPKVYVGCTLGYELIDGTFMPVFTGCNCNYSFNERLLGKTYRQLMFNSTDTKYRPWDKIIHAEEDAIFKAVKEGNSECTTAIVTRYPCEKCAQLLIFKGIKKVYYGRDTPISEETAKMFEEAGVEVIHVTDYKVDEKEGPSTLQFYLNKHIDYINSLDDKFVMKVENNKE